MCFPLWIMSHVYVLRLHLITPVNGALAVEPLEKLATVSTGSAHAHLTHKSVFSVSPQILFYDTKVVIKVMPFD